MIKTYHITRKENLNSILTDGLIPAIGPRSQQLGETEEAVYLFTSFENMDNALYNWLGEVFEDEDTEAGTEIERVLLEVEIEDEYFIDPDDFYEIAYPAVIPPSQIAIIDDYEI